MTTRLDTLGGLRVYQDGLELTSLPRRPIQCALLVYLAVERTATRDAVMTVLWPDKDLEKARGSLNNTAYELRMALGDDWIAAQGNSLQIREDIETDLSVLSSAVAEERFGDAVQVVSGGFLDGLHLARSTEFEQWVDRHRSRVKELERTAHRGLVQLHVQAGDVSKAVASARKWVNCVPYDDEAQYWLLRLLAESGRRADALKAHDKFRAALLGEFGVEPDEAVRELVERIRGGEIAGFSPPPQPSPARTAPRDISEPAPRDGHTPEEVWRPYPGWGKKLIKTLGVYLVPAYGLLQLLSLLIENGILPQELFRPALMLVLLGIPVVSATAFLQSHPVDLRARTGLQLWVTRWFTWRNTALGGVAAAAAYAAAVIALPPERPSWSNVPSSVVVLPFQLPASSEAEWALAVELVEDMTRELSSWESMNIASSIAVTGARLELGLTGPALRRANDGVDIARALESRAMIAVTSRIRGDSVRVEATLYDGGSGLRSGETVTAEGSRADRLALIGPVLARVLGFRDAANALAAFGSGSRKPEAAAAYLGGLRELAGNRLDSAEARFRDAVGIDSTYASAMVSLARTIFWRDDGDTLRMSEVSRWSTGAMAHLQGLAPRNRLDVEGFYAFQLGDYALARRLYREILESEPENVDALMMVGQIEMYDSWMSMDASGRVSPRASLNRAWDAFSEAARIQPTYEPAYGRLIDVQDLAERAYDLGACPGFDLVTDEIRPPWARWTPSDQARAFCPAVLDSITWLTRAEFASADRARLRAGADRLSRETENALKRWGSFSPRQSRPLEQLADLLMSRRTRFEVASPERLRVMAADALELASSALSLATDTSAAQLTNLANLYLASGQQEMAVGLAREIVALYADSLRLAPKNLLNVLVAAGQTTAALRVAAGPGGWRGFRDSESGGFISYAGAESTLTRLRVLGALGVSGPIIQAELDSLDQKLGGAGYPPRERQLLRDSATLRLMPSLAADPAALRRWAAGVSVDRPLWQGLALAATDTAQAIAHLERAQEAGSSGLGDATESFLLGVLAGRLGRRAEAVQHLSRLDSIPHRLDEAWEIGWGLQVLSHLLRGEHYEVLGEFANALEQYQLFQSARMWPDSISGNAGERAMSGIRRVSNGR